MDYDKEIELLVNFYAKPGEKEMLEAAVRTLVDRVKRTDVLDNYAVVHKCTGRVPIEYQRERIPNGSGMHIYP